MEQIIKYILESEFEKAYQLLSEVDNEKFWTSDIYLAIEESLTLNFITFILYYVDKTKDYSKYRDIEYMLTMNFMCNIDGCYSMAAYYKKKMIELDIFKEENLKEILTMTNPNYFPEFKDEYKLEIIDEILSSDGFSEELKILAKKENYTGVN